MSYLPRKNGWTIGEHAGDATPDPTQRLLNHAVWDHEQAMRIVRGFVVEQLADQPLVVAALDESGQEKTGDATVGVQRQYMGCAGRIANGVNTVYCCYATPCGGHALVGARVYVPADQLADPARRAACGIGQEVTFRTKPQLALDICRGIWLADATMPPWAAGDEVYGRSGQLPDVLAGQPDRLRDAGRVRVPRHRRTRQRQRPRRSDGRHLAMPAPTAWQVCSVTGSKGERAYAWAWIATTSPRHYLLIRKHLRTGELAYHYCFVPEGRPVTLMTLVRVACLRWPVEEGFEFGKDHSDSTTRRFGSTPRCRGISCSPSPRWLCARSPPPRPEPAHPPRSCPPHPMNSHRMIPG